MFSKSLFALDTIWIPNFNRIWSYMGLDLNQQGCFYIAKLSSLCWLKKITQNNRKDMHETDNMAQDISNLILNNNPKSLSNVTAINTTKRSYICTNAFYCVKNETILLYLWYFFFSFDMTLTHSTNELCM